MKNKITLLLMALFLGTGSVLADDVEIGTVDQWKSFVTTVKTTPSTNAKLTANITLPENADDFANTYMVGTSSSPYSGTFDGQGFTVTYNKSSLSENIQGLFRYVSGATIKNFHTAGSLSSSGHLLGGIVGNAVGSTTIVGCSSSLSLTSSDTSEGRIGGLVARCADSGATLTISNCLFNGSLSSGKSGRANGLVAWSNGTTVNLSNCLVAPKSVTNGGERFSNVRSSENNLYYIGSDFATNTGGTEATTDMQVNGELAYKLQGEQTTLYWGQANLNKSNAETFPVLTSDATKKVYKIMVNGVSNYPYGNRSGAVPNPVRYGYTAFSTESTVANRTTPLTAISSDYNTAALYGISNIYTLTIGSALASTLVLPYDATIPENISAYTLTYTSGNAATATKITTGTIPANIPVLINATAAGDYTFYKSGYTAPDNAAITWNGATVSHGALTGVYVQNNKSGSYNPTYYVPVGSYVLQNNPTYGLGFYQVQNENTIRITSFRAYLTAQASMAPARLNITFDDNNTTGIKNVSEQANNDDAIYTLNGTRVDHPVKGLYIKNGKKFIVK